MAGPKMADRVKETSTTTGTGTLNLAGAATGFISFVAGIGNGNSCYYAIKHQSLDEWEVGIGTVTDATPDTLSRDTVLASTNGGSAVTFSAGTKDVWCTLPAGIAAISGQTAIADLAEADQISVYKASLQAMRKAALAPMLGRRNILLNGDFSIHQRLISSGAYSSGQVYGTFMNATTTNGSAVVTGLSSTTGLSVGMVVSGNVNIPAGRTIASIDSATQVTLNSGTSVTAGTGVQTNFYPGDNAYAFDRWRGLSETSGTVGYQVTAGGPAGAWFYPAILSNVADEKFGIWQIVEGRRCQHLRGKTVTLSAYLKASDARVGSLKMAIVELGSGGTEDSVSGDPISSWGSAGTAPTLATNYSYKSDGGTPASIAVTTSFVKYEVEATLSSDFKNLAVFIWCDDKTFNAFDSFSVSDVQLEAGSFPTMFDRRPFEAELLECQRYFVRFANHAGSDANICFGGAFSTTQTFHTLPFPTFMRIVPTLTFSGGAGAFKVSNSAGSGVAVTAAPTAGGIHRNLCSVYGVVASGLTAGNASAFQATSVGYIDVSAEL